MKTSFIACGPSGFAGAGRVMCNGLWSAAEHGVRCVYVGPRTPFPWRYRGSGGVSLAWRDEPVRSGAIGPEAAIANEFVLLPFELADVLVKTARLEVSKGYLPTIWAHYLFPYGVAGVLAADLLHASGLPTQLWLNPAGSDIWEVAPQLRELATGILNHPLVKRIVTYSPSFAAEISEGFGISRRIDVLKPCLSGEHHRLPTIDRAAARRRLGMPAGAFVISMHSNMRPVKAPEDVLCVARRVAGLLEKTDVVLLLAGPDPAILPDSSHLDIWRLGLIVETAELLQIADVELNLSRHDSFNLSLAEAMGCGVPVVTTDVVGIAPDIRSCEAGATIALEPAGCGDPRRSYRDAVDALCRFGVQEAERESAGIRATEYAALNFSSTAYWGRLRQLIAGGNR